MVTDRDCPRRRSIRLTGFDYSQPGAYFLTICSADRKCTFSSIENAQIRETALGRLLHSCWMAIPEHFPATELDEFVIMPNHLHAILNIKAARFEAGVLCQEAFAAPTVGSIPTIVRTFKAAVTRLARKQEKWSCAPI